MTSRQPGSPAARRLDERLHQQLRWLRLRLVARAGLILLAGWGLLIAAAALALPGLERFGEPAAWGLRAVVLLALVWVLVVELWLPLRRISGLERFAAELERHEAWNNVLSAATQFRFGDVPPGASPELVDAILAQAAGATERTALARRVPLPDLGTHMGFALAALLIFAITSIASPLRLARVSELIGDPGSLVVPEAETGIYSMSGDLRVPVGEAVELMARDFTGTDEPLVLEVDRTGGFWQQTELAAAQVSGQGGWREIRVEIDFVEDPFRYRFRRGTVVSEAAAVTIHERPVVTGVTLELEPPGYAGREVRVLENPAGAVNALEGTFVRLRGEASSLLASAGRREGDALAEMPIDGLAFADTFTVLADREFRIELVDADGFAGEALTVYRIVVEQDLPPSVEILAPAEDLPLERDLKIDVSAVAADDVGLSRLDLIWRHDGADEWERIPLLSGSDPSLVDLRLDRGENDVALTFTWDLGEVDLLPGDGLAYALEAIDNNARVGGQVTRSQTWRLRLPTISELFDTDRSERAESDDDLRELLTEGQELRDDLERLNRELLKNPDPEWQKREEIRETLERQEELRENLEDAADDLRRQMDDFERDNAGNLETLEKMEMVQELLQDLKDDESLQAWLEAMQDAMEDLSPLEIQRQMEDSLTQQEEFNRRLDRTIELLKELERERRMSDLVEETNEYLDRQRELAELTDPESGEESESGEQSESEESEGEQSEDGEQSEGEQSEGEQSENGEQSEGEQSQEQMGDEELAEMQERLREEVEQLEERILEELERLRNESESGEQQSPSAEEMQKALEEALEQMQQEMPSESMGEASDQLQEGERGEAQESQEEAQERLLKLYQIFVEGQSMMQEQSGKFAGDKLQQTAFDLLQLSHREEIVVDALRDGGRGQNMRPLTREQSRISRATGKLSGDLDELARQNFNVPERLLGELRDLVELSEATGEELEFGRAGRSRESARDVMGDMNRLVTGLLTAAQSASGGGGGSASASPSEQMRQMAEEQGRLNGMTREMRKSLEDGLSGEERRRLAEMQARQQAIREQLEQLREELDDERRVLGDLEDLAESMEQVENELGQGQLSEDLQREQENIQSRLLDAERSIRERDFAKRRESREGGELFSDQIGEDRMAGEADQQDALRRYTAPERAPEAWREDVRQYFRSIQRELDQQSGGNR
jgi:hypothetical protein